MLLSKKIKKAVESHPEIILLLKNNPHKEDWVVLTRTYFDKIARIINKKITKEVIEIPAFIEQNLIIGKLKLEKEIFSLKCESVNGFIKYLAHLSEYQLYNWVSGKTLQSFWNDGEAKYIKINALLVFLQVPYSEWAFWSSDETVTASHLSTPAALPNMLYELSKHSLAIVKNYYLGNYYLYYQKTDSSNHIIKTAFVLKEHESGQIIIQSVSEGHRYIGKVMGLRDGCLYINCQNLDFEEMEQYVFNIGLETKPEVLFGVSTTVSVKERLGVALKNVLVKQKSNLPNFENEPEIEIPFTKTYHVQTEESIIVNYLKRSANNIIKTQSCCNLADIKNK
jgi:hypothetical protein